MSESRAHDWGMLGNDLASPARTQQTDMADQEDRVRCRRCGQPVPRSELQGGRCPGCVANDY
jgi:Zn finger protein HypA/HybF involved in hydrogenase expression